MFRRIAFLSAVVSVVLAASTDAQAARRFSGKIVRSPVSKAIGGALKPFAGVSRNSCMNSCRR